MMNQVNFFILILTICGSFCVILAQQNYQNDNVDYHDEIPAETVGTGYFSGGGSGGPGGIIQGATTGLASRLYKVAERIENFESRATKTISKAGKRIDDFEARAMKFLYRINKKIEERVNRMAKRNDERAQMGYGYENKRSTESSEETSADNSVSSEESEEITTTTTTTKKPKKKKKKSKKAKKPKNTTDTYPTQTYYNRK